MNDPSWDYLAALIQTAEKELAESRRELGQKEQTFAQFRAADPNSFRQADAGGRLLSDAEIEERLRTQIENLRAQVHERTMTLAHHQGLANMPEPGRSQMLRLRVEQENNRRRRLGLPELGSPEAAPAQPQVSQEETIRRQMLERQKEQAAKRGQNPTFVDSTAGQKRDEFLKKRDGK
jgi:hypothetical protein